MKRQQATLELRHLPKLPHTGFIDVLVLFRVGRPTIPLREMGLLGLSHLPIGSALSALEADAVMGRDDVSALWTGPSFPFVSSICLEKAQVAPFRIKGIHIQISRPYVSS